MREVIVVAPHLAEAVRVSVVAQQMRHMGPPTILAIEAEGKVLALEGSHRLAAARHLGVEPRVVLVPHDSMWQRRRLRQSECVPVRADEIAGWFRNERGGRVILRGFVQVESADWVTGDHQADWLEEAKP